MTTSELLSGSSSYPEPSRAAIVLVLALLGIAFLGITFPFAWVLGNRELAAIDAGKRPPGNRKLTQVGRTLGIVGTIFFAGIVAVVTLAFMGVIEVR